jgi:TrmH family RNA methyltransferase
MTPQALGAHNPRLAAARRLLRSRERRARGRFLLEGSTLLGEAHACGVTIDEVFSTAEAFEKSELLRQLDAQGVTISFVDERALRKLSDVESPPGVVAVARTQPAALEDLFAEPGLVLILADLNDAGNAGTLVRTADAFGVQRVVFGAAGVEPYHPKVVRAAMGSLFRQDIAVGDPASVAAATRGAGWTVAGLCAGAEPVSEATLPARLALVVGHERRGLGDWDPACDRRIGIPTPGQAESLNAAVAGAIALYEASRRMA